MVIDGACNLYILIYIFIYSHLSWDPSRLSPTVANSKFCCCCCTSLKKNTNNLCCKKNNKKTTYFLIIFSLLISYVWQPSCTSAQFCEVSARVKTCLCARSLSLSHTHTVRTSRLGESFPPTHSHTLHTIPHSVVCDYAISSFLLTSSYDRRVEENARSGEVNGFSRIFWQPDYNWLCLSARIHKVGQQSTR